MTKFNETDKIPNPERSKLRKSYDYVKTLLIEKPITEKDARQYIRQAYKLATSINTQDATHDTAQTLRTAMHKLWWNWINKNVDGFPRHLTEEEKKKLETRRTAYNQAKRTYESKQKNSLNFPSTEFKSFQTEAETFLAELETMYNTKQKPKDCLILTDKAKKDADAAISKKAKDIETIYNTLNKRTPLDSHTTKGKGSLTSVAPDTYDDLRGAVQELIERSTARAISLPKLVRNYILDKINAYDKANNTFMTTNPSIESDQIHNRNNWLNETKDLTEYIYQAINKESNSNNDEIHPL